MCDREAYAAIYPQSSLILNEHCVNIADFAAALLLYTSSEINFTYEKQKAAEKCDFIVRNAADGAEITVA